MKDQFAFVCGTKEFLRFMFIKSNSNKEVFLEKNALLENKINYMNALGNLFFKNQNIIQTHVKKNRDSLNNGVNQEIIQKLMCKTKALLKNARSLQIIELMFYYNLLINNEFSNMPVHFFMKKYKKSLANVLEKCELTIGLMKIYMKEFKAVRQSWAEVKINFESEQVSSVNLRLA